MRCNKTPNGNREYCLFDLICSWYFSLWFISKVSQLSSLENHSFFEGKTSYKNEIIPLLSVPKNKQTKNIFNKKHVRHVFIVHCWVCVIITPLKNLSSKEAQLGASPPQQSLWMFLVGSKAVWSGRDGFAAELSYFRRCKRTKKGGRKVLMCWYGWVLGKLRKISSYTHTIWVHSSGFCRQWAILPQVDLILS